MTGHCPRCHYHRPRRTLIIVVRVTCPNCHFIQQMRRSPPFPDPTPLIAWLADQRGVPRSSSEFPESPSMTEEVPHAREPFPNDSDRQQRPESALSRACREVEGSVVNGRQPNKLGGRQDHPTDRRKHGHSV